MPEIKTGKFRKLRKDFRYGTILIGFFIKHRKDLLHLKDKTVSLLKTENKTPKLMITWLKARLSEASTVRSVVGFASVIGVTINPDMIQQIATFAVSLLSFIEFVRAEKK
jgi:hypothetical protein